MPQVSMSVKRVENVDIRNWFIAGGVVNGKKVSGYGISSWKAIEDAFRDYWTGWRLN